MSPLQQLIAEDQQAKGDPGDDEIKGLDAKVLLNTDTLEDGEPVTLDFKGQAEMPSSHPPPLCNSCTPPTLQQSPPVSVQPSTSTINPVQQLVQALLTISQNTATPPTLPQPANPVSKPRTHSMAPTPRTCEHSYCSAKSPSTHTCNSTQQMPPKSFSPSAI